MSRLRNSNRRRKEANSEGEQHEAAECIDRDVYRTDHLKLAQLIIVSGARHEAQRPVMDRAQRAPLHVWDLLDTTRVEARPYCARYASTA